MAYLRTRFRLFAALGLAALALQVAFAFGHYHDIVPQPDSTATAAQAVNGAALDQEAALVALHSQAAGAPHSQHAGGDHHEHAPGHGDGGACDICWLRSHAQQAALLALPLPAVQPVTYQRISYGTKPQARPVMPRRTPVQARAPPFAAPV